MFLRQEGGVVFDKANRHMVCWGPTIGHSWFKVTFSLPVFAIYSKTTRFGEIGLRLLRNIRMDIIRSTSKIYRFSVFDFTISKVTRFWKLDLHLTTQIYQLFGNGILH